MTNSLGNPTAPSRSAGGRRMRARGGVALVAAALAGTLVVPLSAERASAAVAGGTQISQTFNAKAAVASCRVDPATNPAYRSSLPVGGGRSTLRNSSYRAVLSSTGSPVAYLNSSMTTDTSVVTRSGGLGSFAISESGSASVTPTKGTCGSGLQAYSQPFQAVEVIQPARVSGWLDLAVAARGTGSWQVFAYAYLLPPSGGGTAVVPETDVRTGWSRHVYVPAGWSVDVRMTATAKASLYNPANTARSAGTVSASFRGVFTPAGAVITPARGAKLARRSVLLPSAVSCAGSAAVRVTRYAKKHAKSVTFLVNGHRVRRLKRIRHARTLGIRVPTSGPIQIVAKVTPKHGRTVKVRRSYAACH